MATFQTKERHSIDSTGQAQDGARYWLILIGGRSLIPLLGRSIAVCIIWLVELHW